MLLSVLRVIRSLPVELRHMAFHHMRMTAGEDRTEEERRGDSLYRAGSVSNGRWAHARHSERKCRQKAA